jgi:hypothetical protein
MKLIKEAKRWQVLAGILKEQDENSEKAVPDSEIPDEVIPNKVLTINKAEAKRLIKDTKGKFFTVTFIKRTDGTKRVMNARLGVKAYLKGGELPYQPEPKGLIPVFDIPKRAYRMINLDTITNLKIGTSEYEVK